MSAARPGDAVLARVAAIAAELRAVGAPVGPGRLQEALRALDAVTLARRDDAYHALRATLVSRHEDLDAFDDAFRRVWEGWAGDEEAAAPAAARSPEPGQRGGGDGADERSPAAVRAYSAIETLRRRDFASLTPDELAQVARLMRDAARLAPRRRSRRLTPGGRRALDLRATLREASRSDGLPLRRRYREPKIVPRRLLLVLDVSGSMEPYARALVLFAHALRTAAAQRSSVEAFAFGTRLTHLTPLLDAREPETALAGAAEAMRDWGGGTRIGAALRDLNRTAGRLTRGAAVVIASDGWERGDLDLLDRELGRLARSARTLVWLNPLSAREGYAPLIGGMRTALPHVDVFRSGNDLASLEALLATLGALDLGSGGRRGRSARLLGEVAQPRDG